MRPIWLKVSLLLVAVWLLVGAVILLAKKAKPTPDSISAYLNSRPLTENSPSGRQQALEKVANQLNQLSFEDRRSVRMSKPLDLFFRDLDPAEQARFLDLTLPTGFKQMMESLNRMPPEKRKKFVAKALEDMRNQEGEHPPEEEMNANAKKMIEQGFKSFYSEANADVKLDVAPLIEQLQKNLQNGQ